MQLLGMPPWPIAPSTTSADLIPRVRGVLGADAASVS